MDHGHSFASGLIWVGTSKYCVLLSVNSQTWAFACTDQIRAALEVQKWFTFWQFSVLDLKHVQAIRIATHAHKLLVSEIDRVDRIDIVGRASDHIRD